ncbi:hypothetical protein PGH43_04865 [Legionella pneumophila 130b]|nr:hypothetical protein PGH43_04865 [Legionella pneumophila 130b]
MVDIRSAKNEEGGVNYFIYYEVPDNLKEKDKSVQIEFLKDLLKLKYGFEDIDFTIHSFGHFPVFPSMSISHFILVKTYLLFWQAVIVKLNPIIVKELA